MSGGRGRRRRGVWLLLGALLAGCWGERAPSHAYAIPGADGDHLQVEVLNASGKAGLARTGTRVLRQVGIDVVFFGNAGGGVGMLDSTRIVVRRGAPGAGERVRQALGVGNVVVELDSTRLLDVSVFLGADFAPRLDFHP